MTDEIKKTNSKAKKAPAKKTAKKTASKKSAAKKTSGRGAKIKDMTKEVITLIKEEIKEKANRDIISQDEEHKFINAITKKFKKAKEEAQILFQIGKLSIEVSGLKRDLPGKYKILGEKAYELINEKKIELPAMKAQLDNIRKLNSRVSDTEKKIQDLKKAAKSMME